MALTELGSLCFGTHLYVQRWDALTITYNYLQLLTITYNYLQFLKCFVEKTLQYALQRSQKIFKCLLVKHFSEVVDLDRIQ